MPILMELALVLTGFDTDEAEPLTLQDILRSFGPGNDCRVH